MSVKKKGEEEKFPRILEIELIFIRKKNKGKKKKIKKRGDK